MNIDGLSEFAVSETELDSKYADTKFDISIRVPYYPDIAGLKPLTLKERRLIICQHLRDQFKVLKANYPTTDYQLIGSRIRPYGLEGQLTGKQLFVLKKNDYAQRILILNIEGRQKIKKEKKLEFYSVEALFVAEAEGIDYTNTVRATEERIILLQALNQADAISKAMLEFKAYEEAEYLVTSYRFLKWKFLKILKVYEMGVTEIDPDGTEVYSVGIDRKLKAEDHEEYR